MSPVVFTNPPTLGTLIEAVNANTDRVHSYYSPNARIAAPNFPGLRTTIALERPRRFRLQAELFGQPSVDLGSNDELFWFWIKQNEPPALFFCRHSQYAGSQAARLLPVRPEWLIEALGLVRLEPAHQHEGPWLDGQGLLCVRSLIPTETGQLTRQLKVDSRRPLVLEQHLYNARGQTIASAVATGHRYDPVQQVSLPTQVRVTLPHTQLSLEIDTGSFRLNQPIGDPQQLWVKPVYPGVMEVDLGSVPPAALSQPPTTPAPRRVSRLPTTGIPLQRLPAVPRARTINR